MGINAIRCEGLYAEVKDSRFGEGGMSSSDFNGKDVLKGAAVVALIAAGAFAAGCIGHSEARPATKAEEQHYRFERFGDTKTIHDESTNRTYTLELDGVRGVVWADEDAPGQSRAAHFNVYEVVVSEGVTGKNKVGEMELVDIGRYSMIRPVVSMPLPGTKFGLDVDLSEGYVDLRMVELRR